MHANAAGALVREPIAAIASRSWSLRPPQCRGISMRSGPSLLLQTWALLPFRHPHCRGGWSGKALQSQLTVPQSLSNFVELLSNSCQSPAKLLLDSCLMLLGILSSGTFLFVVFYLLSCFRVQFFPRCCWTATRASPVISDFSGQLSEVPELVASKWVAVSERMSS